MSGTNAAVVKKALADQLTARFASKPEVSDVRVSYSPPGRIEREHVYLGKATFIQAPEGAGMGQVLARQETLTVAAQVYVRIKGGEQEEADARAVEIGGVLEQLLATDPSFLALPSVMFAGVASGELDSGDDDDAVLALVTYELTFLSMLR